VPKEWGKGKPNRKANQPGRKEKPGWRWQNPKNKGDNIRIDKGDPNHTKPSQQVDHVRIDSNGKIVGKNGQNFPAGTKPEEFPLDTHIPLSEWRNWSSWNTP
jgi:hypothetical protein